MLVICAAPIALAFLVGRGHRLWLTGGHGTGFFIDYGVVLGNLPGLVSTVLLAPLAGFRRRIAFWWLFPPVALCYAWPIGERVALLGMPPAQQAATRESIGGRNAEDLIREGLKRSRQS
jgi:hypothetical protein